MTGPVALLVADGSPLARLAGPLRELGHAVVVVPPRPVAPAERVLLRRGFTPELTAVPGQLAALRRDAPGVVVASTAPGAAAARAWRRRSGARVVFACTEVLGRATVADRRLRLRLLAAAVEDSDVVVATDAATRDALWRWTATEAPVLAPDDAAAWDRLLRERVR